MALNADHPAVTALQELLSSKVTEYKSAFSAREAMKEGKPSYKRALSYTINPELFDELNDLGEVILSHENVPTGEMIPVYYAHLSEQLTALAKIFKDWSELNLDLLPQQSVGPIVSEDELLELKDQCDQYFKAILDLTEDPGATGQSYSASGQGGKSFKLDIPRFHKTKKVESTTLSLEINGHKFDTISEACSVTWSIKPSVFLEAWKESGKVFAEDSFSPSFDLRENGEVFQVRVIKVD